MQAGRLEGQAGRMGGMRWPMVIGEALEDYLEK